jgi:hypothetical protein
LRGWNNDNGNSPSSISTVNQCKINRFLMRLFDFEIEKSFLMKLFDFANHTSEMDRLSKVEMPSKLWTLQASA